MESMAKLCIALLTYMTFLLLKLNIAESSIGNAYINEAYKILLIAPVGTRSHKNFFMGTVKALAARGHQVTVLSSFKESTEFPNVRDIVLDGPDVTSVLSDPFNRGQKGIYYDLIVKPPILCAQYLSSRKAQDLKAERFDLLIISPWNLNDCFFSFIHHFKIPYVFISPNSLFGGMNKMAGNIHFESLQGTPLLDMSNPPTFFDRLRSAAMNLSFEILFKVYLFPRYLTICKEAGLCPNDMPSFDYYYGRNSLVIINSVRALENPAQPWMPHVVHAGGIHCGPSNPLPTDLEEWTQSSSEKEFIYFSLGSIVSPSNMPAKYRDIFLKVFGSLKYKVLWKWDQEMIDGLPSNVKLSKWLPQQDILGHPNVRLFISHGGLLSMQESTYHSVPILGMPLSVDQFNNVRQIVHEGWGDKLHWDELNEDLLRSKILSVIGNEEMRKTVKKRSTVMRDRLNHPSDEVAYWIEYVLRHDGADHIKSPLPQLYVWELYNIDVWLFITFTSLLLLVIFVLTCKTICTKLLDRKTKVD